jgi:hypothetical protein
MTKLTMEREITPTASLRCAFQPRTIYEDRGTLLKIAPGGRLHLGGR